MRTGPPSRGSGRLGPRRSCSGWHTHLESANSESRRDLALGQPECQFVFPRAGVLGVGAAGLVGVHLGVGAGLRRRLPLPCAVDEVDDRRSGYRRRTPPAGRRRQVGRRGWSDAVRVQGGDRSPRRRRRATEGAGSRRAGDEVVLGERCGHAGPPGSPRCIGRSAPDPYLRCWEDRPVPDASAADVRALLTPEGAALDGPAAAVRRAGGARDRRAAAARGRPGGAGRRRA